LATRKGWGPHLLERRSYRIEAATELIEASGAGPPGKLAADIQRIDIAGQQETGFEDRLVADSLQQIPENHGDNLPELASYCNKSGTPAREDQWCKLAKPYSAESTGMISAAASTVI
jgi:hypothetical protein